MASESNDPKSGGFDLRNYLRYVHQSGSLGEGAIPRLWVAPTIAAVPGIEGNPGMYDVLLVGQLILVWDSGSVYRKPDDRKYRDGGRAELFAVGAKAHAALEARVAALESTLAKLGMPRGAL